MILIIKIILVAWIVISAIVVFVRYCATSPFDRAGTSASGGTYYRSSCASLSFKASEARKGVYISGRHYNTDKLEAIYQYLVNYNPLYYFKLPRWYGRYFIVYNFITGTIYIGCSRMPKKIFLEIYNTAKRPSINNPLK